MNNNQDDWDRFWRFVNLAWRYVKQDSNHNAQVAVKEASRIFSEIGVPSRDRLEWRALLSANLRVTDAHIRLLDAAV